MSPGEAKGEIPGLPDTTGGALDSTLRASDPGISADTSYVVFLDSTARLAHFSYVPRDRPQVLLFRDRTYPLFASNRAPGFRREVKIDSTGSTIHLRETYNGHDVRVPISMPLKEYVALRRRYELRRALADEARRPKTLAPRDDVGELLSTITKIQIPIPANPILSIFGKNEINLNISGAVDIKAGFRNTKSDQTQVLQEDQSRNEPDFSQEVQVAVNGTIGDKLNILADWNTQRTFEYENQLKIKYTGYEDEIVQSVEAGNVSLQTPSSFVGSSQALFGVKARFQAGPFTLTTLASQKKGQIKEVNVSGGAQEIPFEIQAYNYSTNHFFVDTSYRQYYEPYYQNEPAIINEQVKIEEEEVWVELTGFDPTQIANARQGKAFISLDPYDSTLYSTLRTREDIPGQIEPARFVRLLPSQYELTANGHIGVLTLNTNVQDQQIVAIAYRRFDGVQVGEFVNDLVDTTGNRPLVLKMVKPKNLLANGRRYAVAWNQMLKNIYPLGSRNVKKEGFTLDIFRTIPGAENENAILNTPLLRVLGLDKYNADETVAPQGDGQFDFRPLRTINQARAEIIFPFLRPFDAGIRTTFVTLEDSSEFLFSEVYDTTRTFASQSPRARYIIKGKATGETTSKYSLGFNVVEGSVQVLLDDRPLTPNVDYSVDYIVGEVIIRNDRALVPGANLKIKYEQNDLFQLASKTLLGARGDLALGQNAGLGFTVMNLNQQTLSDKVRLGEEPNNNTILGVDGATNFNLPFLSRAIDALPLLQTREQSNFRISGEAAYMLPDPNTKKSPIVGDENEGIAYIDDFEGARRTIPLGITYTQWTLGSPPADSVANASFGTVDSIKTYSKGKMVWFNDFRDITPLTDIWPRKEPGSAANNRTTVLDMKYYPAIRGQYNYSPDLPGTLTPTKNWAAVMKPISIAATNFITENISFIEIWMQVNRAPSDGSARMIIDLGAITEDVIANRELNSEDLKLINFPNGTLQEGEDVGLDMMTNAEEQARYPGLGGDPSGDDYAFDNTSQTEDFSRINGTENNRTSPGGLIPDTEDLNGNNTLDQTNSYFQYEFPLDSVNNPYIVGGGNNRWYQFRIPVREWIRQVGTPNFENVEFVRVGFRNVTDTVAVRIADFGLVGNQWQEVDKSDPTFDVSVVSIEDNPDYESPPGVIRERDRTRPDEFVLANEQSLALVFEGVRPGESRYAFKYYTFRPLDLFNYRKMKMFVYGDARFATLPDPPQLFFRFGADSLNYYEYRGPIYPGWDVRNEMVVDFPELTAIKQLRDSISQVVQRAIRQVDGDSVVYRVVGNPSLTAVRYLAVGVRYRYDDERIPPNPQLLYGQVWVNELRVLSVDDSPGWAYRMDTQLKLADLATVAFNYQKVDPNFHTLEQRFGSRQLATSYGVSASMQLEKFFPTDWAGTSLPVSYSHTVSKIEPKYLPNSDVLVSEAAEQQRIRVINRGGTDDEAQSEARRITLEAESYRVTDTYAAPSFKLGLPFQDWYIRDTFNKLIFGFNYTKSTERNPAIERRLNWSWNAKIGYSLTFSPEYFIAPFKDLFDGIWLLDEYKGIKFFFTPTNFTWSVNAVRSRDVSLQRVRGAEQIISRQFNASRQIGFGWKLTEGGLLNLSGDYNLNIESTLLDLETDRFGQQRPFSRIINDIFFGDRLVYFGKDTRYGQRNQFSTRPNIPNIFNIKKYLDVSFSYGVDYAWQNTLTSGDIGKSAAFTNTINFSSTFRMKQLFDPLFEDKPATPAAPARGRRGGGGGETERSADTTDTEDPPPAQGPGALDKALTGIKAVLKLLIKTPLLDYDNVNFTFTQTNAAQNTGVVGRTGFQNFWGRVPFFEESKPRYGPSRLYQLGLISDPHGRLTNFGWRSKFPFFGWDVVPGIRAASQPGVAANLTNSYRQTNRLTFKTSRALWEGARIDLTWNVGWTYSRTQTLTTDEFGNPTITTTNTAGSVERSFLTFPDVLFLGSFKTGLKEVGKKYAALKPDSGLTDEQKLTRAFEEGFEALPFFRNVFGQFFPRANWAFRWDGLEKLSIFSGFVSKLSLDHAYMSTYTRQFRNLPGGATGGGGERTDGQRVTYGFSPLARMNFTFKELLKGSFGMNVSYSTTTSFDFITSSRNLVEALTQEIMISASYARKGFEIPLFGIALNNDLDVSASYSLSKSSRRTYDVSKLDITTQGAPLEGSTRTVIEPRIKYVLSARVSASIYYRYTKTAPDAAAGSRIPGSTVNEAGLDIHIAIQ